MKKLKEQIIEQTTENIKRSLESVAKMSKFIDELKASALYNANSPYRDILEEVEKIAKQIHWTDEQTARDDTDFSKTNNKLLEKLKDIENRISSMAKNNK